MPSDVANGSVLIFGTNVTDVINLGFSSNGNPIDLTDLLDTNHKYAPGIPDLEVTATVTGAAPYSPAYNTTGAALTLTWNDGTTAVSTVTYICVSANTSGGVDQPITTQLTFKPSI